MAEAETTVWRRSSQRRVAQVDDPVAEEELISLSVPDAENVEGSAGDDTAFTASTLSQSPSEPAEVRNTRHQAAMRPVVGTESLPSPSSTTALLRPRLSSVLLSPSSTYADEKIQSPDLSPLSTNPYRSRLAAYSPTAEYRSQERSSVTMSPHPHPHSIPERQNTWTGFSVIEHEFDAYDYAHLEPPPAYTPATTTATRKLYLRGTTI